MDSGNGDNTNKDNLMNTLKLTKKDFKETDNYWKEYIGKTDVSDYGGHIEIDENLGHVRFNSISAKGYIIAESGTGIEAGEGIEAGWGIEAGTGIKAGEGIEAGWGIKAGTGIEAGEGIKAGTGIEAGLSITCKLSISWSYKMFAGICYWRDCDDSEKTITCSKLEPKNGATVEYGIVKETGIVDILPGKEVDVVIDGKSYKAIIQ